MGVKIALLLVKNVFINVGEGINELACWIAAKHTTNIFRCNTKELFFMVVQLSCYCQFHLN